MPYMVGVNFPVDWLFPIQKVLHLRPQRRPSTSFTTKVCGHGRSRRHPCADHICCKGAGVFGELSSQQTDPSEPHARSGVAAEPNNSFDGFAKQRGAGVVGCESSGHTNGAFWSAFTIAGFDELVCAGSAMSWSSLSAFLKPYPVMNGQTIFSSGTPMLG